MISSYDVNATNSIIEAEAVNLKEIAVGQGLAGYAFVKSVAVNTYTPRGSSEVKKYMTFKLAFKGAIVSGKLWDYNPALEALSHVCVWFNGECKEYRGQKEITIKTLGYVNNQNAVYVFEDSLDSRKIWQSFWDSMGWKPECKISQVLNAYVGLYGLELLEDCFAASKYHDNVRGGLINHSVKMMNLARVLISNDARLEPYSDLLYLGCFLHDIGKTMEIYRGEYTKNSFVTHRVFGIEILTRLKETIVSVYDEDFYWRLVSIVQGHHGEWGDPPNTVWAKLIHLIDMLDSTATNVVEALDNNSYKTDEIGQMFLYNDNVRLYI